MRILLLSCFFIISKSALSQIEIKGKIIDAETKEPLTGVVIILQKNTTVTGINGEFVLKTDNVSFPLQIECRLIGYATATVSVQKNEYVTVNLKQSNKILNQVVVSAQRNAVNVYRITSATEVIKPYLVENKITTNMNKLVDQIPSVNVVDGQINIRNGSGWSYGAGSRVLVLLDGMPFLTGDAGQVQWKFLPIENVEQVEVIKGASSVLYGSSALNGMINITTKQATEKPYTKINFFSGVYSQPTIADSLYPFNSMQKSIGFNAFHARKFGSNKNNSLSIAANALNDEGYRLGEFDKRVRLNYNFSFKPKPLITYGIAGGVLLTDAASFLLWNGFNQRYTALNKEVTVTKSVNVFVDPTLTFFTNTFKHDIKTRFLHVNNDVKNPNQNQDNSSDLWYADYQLSKNIDDLKLLLIAGGTYLYTSSKAPLFNGINTSENRAIFINAEKFFFKHNKLIVNAGLRYEYFAMNGIAESKPVKRFGINYMPLKYTFIRASYGEGYRFPSIAEKYIITSVGALNIFSNPRLKSETGSNFELGIKQAFAIKDVKGFLDFAYYDMRFNNMIEFNFGMWGGTNIFDLKNFGFKSVNVGAVKISGFDFSMGADGKIKNVLVQAVVGYTFSNPKILNPDFVFETDSFKTPYTFRNTRSDSTDFLKYRFRHLAKVDLQFTYKKFLAGFSVRYNSFMPNIDAAFIYLNPSIPDIAKGRSMNKSGFTVVDFRMGYKINTNWDINLAISNLMNKEAMTRPADMISPRLTMINISYKF